VSSATVAPGAHSLPKAVATKSNGKPSEPKTASAKPSASSPSAGAKETTVSTPSKSTTRAAVKSGVYDDMQ
jgi:hypothetical protein